ncbi:hypothetical protein MWU75_08775 [Ornithinimicrobium sp. F0845]|uniref:hypothetical protein n=1 Tax=Ornithinimicrobium sp. F0845 TaxID=2926412 RepID=UPI001FF56B00|nr:hypothetical protein [Ornithinimicrobium sp. F0845]MCK0112228.1 hypothetical protein [Ornithinimicrobium sp. F0845]
MHRRTTTTSGLVLSAVACLGLSACGGGDDPLTQEQASQALLTEEDFPLEGFTAGEVQEGAAEEDAAAGELLEDVPGADQFSDECLDALGTLESLDADFTAQSMVEFTGEDTGASLLGPPTVQVIVASMEEGDNPLELIESLNSACDDITVEEEGMSMTMGFNEVEGDAQGTTISMGLLGQTLEVTVAGREDGGNYTVVTAVGLSAEELISVLDAQDEKVANL